MRIVITCGPAIAPLDEVRRLTNRSTGELGTLLAETFAEAGHAVTCLRARTASFPAPLWPVEVVPFETNDELWAHLRALPAREEVQFLFHAAALCDYLVREWRAASGERLTGEKAAASEGPTTLILDPAPKVLASLRRAFPASVLVGWKYELVGDARQALARGAAQIEANLTDGCVVNGTAYGPGFGFITRAGEKVHVADKTALAHYLLGWAERLPTSTPRPGLPSVHHPLATFIPMGRFV